MLANLYQVDLPVSDMDRADSFYRQLLNVPNKRVSPERHHFDCGGMILTCYQAGPQPESTEKVATASPEIFLAVDDLETIFLQAQQAGCTSLDQAIINQPWGHRSFAAQDPFGNSIVFVDEASMQQQMDERLTAGPDDLFHRGVALSIESLAEDSQHQPIAASVAKIFKDEIWIRFAEPSPDARFKDNESVRIRFWVGEEVFLSETTIAKVPSDTEHVAISIPRGAKGLQRRAVPRVALPIPISFSVFASPDSEEVEEKSFQTESQDISTNGIRLETEAPLKEGDKLWLELCLSSSETIRVVARVKRTKQINTEMTLAGVQFVEIQLEDQMKLLKLLIQDGDPEAFQAAPEPEETISPVSGKEDEPVPLEVKADTPLPLDAGQEVGTAQGNEDIPVPLKPEGVAPVTEEEEEEEEGEAEEEGFLLPIVQIVPEVQGGRALLELTNGYHKPIQLKSVLVTGGVHSIQLLEEARELSVEETETLDLTEKLLTLFNPESSRTQYKRFQISLTLEPEPLDQPAPSTCVLSFSKGSFTQFSSE